MDGVFNTIQFDFGSLDEAFPAVDPGQAPYGSRVLVQYRTTKKKSSGGIIIPESVRETEFWNNQVVKVIAVGPLAYHNRNTMQPWPEGAWCKPGDFVRVPKYGGDRWTVPLGGVSGDQAEEAVFGYFDDLNILGAITADPLRMKAYVG